MSRPQTPYGSVPSPNDAQMSRGYASQPNTTYVSDFAQGNPPSATSPLSQSMQHNSSAFHEDFDASQRGSSIVEDNGGGAGLNRSASTASTAVPAAAPARSNTLKKRSSVRRTGSLKRSSSKRSLKAGSLAGFGGVDINQEFHSAFSTPIPTQGAPTEILANRFQAWRQLLKSLIAYFREIQSSYEARAKAAHKVQSTIASIAHPSIFMSEQGLGEATKILDDYHKRSITEANKSREIENDVIGALTGLRSDLGQKIKEIKGLGGDFKNSVEKEKDGTRREVEKLQEALQHADVEDGSAVGKNDPFVVRLGVERAVEKQIDEENYLHRAYLNLESSGRELESIVVGEIQKAYNALAGILKREGDDAYNAVEGLRTGPISLPKDAEWTQFVQNDPHFVDPNIPLRRVEDIEYSGKHHPAAAEVRAGMLERKSKYLKSYTPGWYVLSPTHLHEFKSADKIYSQPPVMSLYLPDQRLGSHSQPGSSSHKFMLKGKQSGSMHKGHNWVFRAETYDTMLAWNADIRALTETTGEERNAFVRKHARSVSGTSDRGTVSSDGMEEDEADAVPYSADPASLASPNAVPDGRLARPQPGGRFPSDVQVPRLQPAPLSPSSTSSRGERDAGFVAAAGALPGSSQLEYQQRGQDPYRLDGVSAGTRPSSSWTAASGVEGSYLEEPQSPQSPRAPKTYQQPSQTYQRDVPVSPQQPQSPAFQSGLPGNQQQQQSSPIPQRGVPVTHQQQQQSFLVGEPADPRGPSAGRHGSLYGEWMAPTAAAAGVVGTGAVAAAATRRGEPLEQRYAEPPRQTNSLPQNVEAADFAARAPGPTERSPISPIGSPRSATAPSPLGITTDSKFDAQYDAAAHAPIPMEAPSTLGGLEKEGAHETGAIFPKVIRHDTEISVSALHVPGKFPRQE